jgi:D-alanine transaminase
MYLDFRKNDVLFYLYSRFHAFPENIQAIVFAYAFTIPAAPIADKLKVKQYRDTSSEDLRWKRCQIKSTSLLGNLRE